VTALFLQFDYKDKQFLRVGYYVNNQYDDQHLDWRLQPPSTVQFSVSPNGLIFLFVLACPSVLPSVRAVVRSSGLCFLLSGLWFGCGCHPVISSSLSPVALWCH